MGEVIRPDQMDVAAQFQFVTDIANCAWALAEAITACSAALSSSSEDPADGLRAVHYWQGEFDRFGRVPARDWPDPELPHFYEKAVWAAQIVAQRMANLRPSQRVGQSSAEQRQLEAALRQFRQCVAMLASSLSRSLH